MDEDRITKIVKAVKMCHDCRAGILTLFTEEKQDDGSWKTIRIQRNCGHTYVGDPGIESV